MTTNKTKTTFIAAPLKPLWPNAFYIVSSIVTFGNVSLNTQTDPRSPAPLMQGDNLSVYSAFHGDREVHGAVQCI